MSTPAAKPRIVLFGGTFDPIHHGHLISARSVAEQLNADRVIFLPAIQSPFKPDQVCSPARDRLEMCRLATAGSTSYETSDWELGQPEPSYSVSTALHFRDVYPPPAHLYWLIGRDSLRWLANWHRLEELVELVTFVTAARPGPSGMDLLTLRAKLPAAAVFRIEAHILPTPQIEISATDIRARVRAGLDIRYLVPDAVAEYIRARGLYRT